MFHKFINLFYIVFILTVIFWKESYSRELRKVLVVAGNFSLQGNRTNLARLDLKTGVWLNEFNSELYMYGEDNGVIWDIAMNKTDPQRLYAVGMFDAPSKASQVQLCSVASSSGTTFEKVGEGLCSRGGDIGAMFIQTVVLGDKGNIFVAGNFATRVWDGHHFVFVYHVAQFDAKSSSWLPLSGGGELKCLFNQDVRVNSLLWDQDSNTLYLGGRFQLVDDRELSSGLATWSPSTGLISFVGGGVSTADNSISNGEVQSLAIEPKTKSLFVAGIFAYVNGTECLGVAVWLNLNSEWKCLYDSSFYMASITSTTIDSHYFYISGWASSISSWEGSKWHSQYAIARLNIDKLVEGQLQLFLAEDNQNEYTTMNFLGKDLNNSFQNEYVSLSNKKTLTSSTHSSQRHLRSRLALNQNSKRHTQIPIVNFTNAPTSFPTSFEPIFQVKWEWLPGFAGCNGPILKMLPGSDYFEGALFIGGAFQNFPSLIVWNAFPEKNGYGNITNLGGGELISGLVTSIVEISVPFESKPSSKPTILPSVKPDDTFAILLSCVGLGVVIGLLFTVTFYRKFPYLDHADYEYHGPDGNIASISLKTLTSGENSATPVNFKECFDRAMKTRHLPTYETLVIINPKEIMLSKIIGEGSFGRVWSGQWRNNPVAVKEFVFAQAAISGGSMQTHNIVDEIVGEAGVMACLRHPKILQLYGCSLTMQAIWIVSELCPKGSLKMMLMSPDLELSIIQKLSICIDIADAMSYLHNRSPPIIHRDLKSHNIFITEPSVGNYVAKIGDWGSARAVALGGTKSMTQGVGTACWLSPEVINNAHFSKSSDVYAFGIVLWEVFTRQEIYEGLSAAQIIAKVAHEGLRPNAPRDCPWSPIMIKCWRQDPMERPTFEKILVSLTKLYHKYHTKYGKKQSKIQSDSAIETSNVLVINNEDTPLEELVPLKSAINEVPSETPVVDDILNEDDNKSNLPEPETITIPNYLTTSEKIPPKYSPKLSENSDSTVGSTTQFYNSVLGSSRKVPSAAHLAPELAELEARGFLMHSQSSQFDNDADPLDFLFRSPSRKSNPSSKKINSPLGSDHS